MPGKSLRHEHAPGQIGGPERRLHRAFAILGIAAALAPAVRAQDADDTVRVTNFGSGESATVVITRRASNSSGTCSCTHEQVSMTASAPVQSIHPGLARLAPACGDSEVFVLSKGHAVSLNHGSSTGGAWTRDQDELKVELAPAAPVRLKIWMLKGAKPAQGTLEDKVDDDVRTAKSLFDNVGQPCGIAVVDERTTIDPPGGVLDWNCGNMTALTRIGSSQQAFDPGRINVYYARVDPSDHGLRGNWCERDTPGRGDDVLFVYAEASNTASLAHEIGHALSLDHVTDSSACAPSCSKYVMYSESAQSSQVVRTVFDMGQCVRMHAHYLSALAPATGEGADRCRKLPFLCPPALLSSGRCE
jgi:hypothetical protein